MSADYMPAQWFKKDWLWIIDYTHNKQPKANNQKPKTEKYIA